MKLYIEQYHKSPSEGLRQSSGSIKGSLLVVLMMVARAVFIGTSVVLGMTVFTTNIFAPDEPFVINMCFVVLICKAIKIYSTILERER